jgi:hypothetical protein
MSVPPIEETVLEHPKVEELAERARLELMPQKGCAIEDDSTGLEDPPQQCRRCDIQNDQVNFVCPEVRSHPSQKARGLLAGILSTLEVHRDVHVAQRRKPPDPCSAE